MNLSLRTSTLAATLSLTALLAAVPAHAARIGTADYKAGKARIAVDFKADKLACQSLTANAKDVCLEEAKAKEKNALAALEYGHTGKPADEKQLLKVQADTAYDVAREKCDDQMGQAKDVCVQQAKTVHTKALADLKLVKAVAAAGDEASEARRAADLKLANEKCDALASDAKTACQSAAQARFGKS